MPLLETNRVAIVVTSTAERLVIAENVKKWFKVRSGLLTGFRGKEKLLHAVDGITLEIREGEALALVGESGCGKSTFARILLGLLRPTEGAAFFDGHDIFGSSTKVLREIRTEMQAVFQDPYGSLDPKKTIPDIVLEPLVVNRLCKNSEEKYNHYAKAMSAVGMNPETVVDKFPYELSGGQRQRVAIARALVINPRFIIADEPVSMLDVSVRAEILGLLLELKQKFNLTYLFITHDLTVARYISDRMAVMYLGKIVEIGGSEDVCSNPVHPYTKGLLSAIPATNPRMRGRKLDLRGEISKNIDIPSGCRFRPRCPYAFEKCSVEPKLISVGKGHYAVCYLAEKDLM